LDSNIPLANVDLLVPLAPDLGRGEHTTGTALVTEGSLTGTVSTTTGDTGDTGDSTTCSMGSHLVSYCSHTEEFHDRKIFVNSNPILPISKKVPNHVPVPQDSAEVCSPAFSLTA
jgi:hypothetical protein